MFRSGLLDKLKQLYPREMLNSTFALHFMEDRRKKDTKFKAYYDILPKNATIFPILFDDEDKKYLEGSRIL